MASMKVAFIGHRKIERTVDLEARLTKTIADLIKNEAADTFLFGSRSEFNSLCYDVVTDLRDTFLHIRRVFVRGEYEVISRSYQTYLLKFYEETFYPPEVHGAGALSYVKRNQVMVDQCDTLIVYCDEQYRPQKANSGTKLAVDYANRKHKRIINLFG